MANAARIIPPLTKQQIERFWSFVDKTGGPEACWPWIGKRYPNQYGKHFIRGLRGEWQAHRIALFLVSGEQPPVGMHNCDNPPCCNVHPKHVQPGDHILNVRDMIARGRRGRSSYKGAWGENNTAAKLTEIQVRTIRERYAAGGVRQRDLAFEYGLTQTGIQAIIAGRNWPNAGGPIIKNARRMNLRSGIDHWTQHKPERLARGAHNGSQLHPDRRPRGEHHAQSKVSDAQASEIRNAIAAGATRAALAKHYGLNWSTIDRVNRRKPHAAS